METIYRLIFLALDEPLVGMLLIAVVLAVLGGIIKHFYDDIPKVPTPPSETKAHWVGKESTLDLPEPSETQYDDYLK